MLGENLMEGHGFGYPQNFKSHIRDSAVSNLRFATV